LKNVQFCLPVYLDANAVLVNYILREIAT